MGEKHLAYHPNHNLLIRLLHRVTIHNQQQILYEYHEYEEAKAALESVLWSS